jgi:outer membrane protein TolC
MEYIDAKDRLYLLGTQLYLGALLEQRLKELYEAHYFQQKRFFEQVQERYRAGVASRIDFLDAKNDLLAIKKQLLEHIYAYLYGDYLLRNSAELDTNEPLRLSWFGVKWKEATLAEYYKRALLYSPQILSQRIKATIAAKELHSLRYFYWPKVDFNLLLFDEYRQDFTLKKRTTGINYQLGFRAEIPLFRPEEQSKIQRAKARLRLERERLKSKIKDVAKDIHKSYNEIEKLQRERQIVQDQLRLSQEKIEVSQKRYLGGVGGYRDYSEAIRQSLRYQEELYRIDAQILSNKIFINLLEGIERLYE